MAEKVRHVLDVTVQKFCGVRMRQLYRLEGREGKGRDGEEKEAKAEPPTRMVTQNTGVQRPKQCAHLPDINHPHTLLVVQHIVL